MRHFAANLFTARDIDFELNVPARGGDLKLDPAARRQVFLIFKETVNNIVRHANCSRVTIDLAAVGGRLILTVSDNGKGLGPDGSGGGHELAKIRRRAEALGGTIAVLSREPKGVVVKLTISLERPRKPIWRRFLHI